MHEIKIFDSGLNCPVQGISNHTSGKSGWFQHGKKNAGRGRGNERKRKREGEKEREGKGWMMLLEGLRWLVEAAGGLWRLLRLCHPYWLLIKRERKRSEGIGV